MTFTFSLFDKGICFVFTQVNELNLTRNQKSNREKVHEPKQIFLKNNHYHDTWKKSGNAKKQKKVLDFFLKKTTFFEFQTKNI